MLTEIVRLCEAEGSLQAIALIQSQGDPATVADAYAQLVPDLYYKQKDAPLMLMIGRAGVQYCLDEARRCEKDDAELAATLRGTAKAMAFNLSVNCWPAWEDEGITLTDSDVRNGYDLARLNLRLAIELKRDAAKRANAHWLLGAHQLAAQESTAAIGSFQKAAELFQQAKQPDGEQMALGYTVIAKLTTEEEKADGERELKAAVEKLREIDTDDSRFYADQLESVAKFFTK